MTLGYLKPLKTIVIFDRPINFDGGQFVTNGTSYEVLDKGDCLKVLLPASCYVDDAEWAIVSYDGNVTYIEGNFKKIIPKPR